MYRIETMRAPETDSSNEEIEYDYDDLVSAIELNLPNGSKVSRENGLLKIQADLSEKELKDCMRPAFSYHFDSIRFVSISKG